MTIPWGAWKPDVSDYNGDHTQRAENVFPRGDGYGPVPDLAAFTQALPAACRGAFLALNTDGTIAIFAGTATKLYKMSNTDLSWDDVTRASGGDYAVPAANQWQFAQLGSVVVAVNGADAVQAYTLGSSTDFAALAGSPPIAAYVTVVNEFVVLSGLSSNPFRIQWSARSNAAGWTSGTDESDFQDFTDGGVVRGVAGGEFGLVFHDNAMRNMIYQPGSAVVFSFDRIAEGKGLRAPYSLVKAGERIFFKSASGFEMVVPGGQPTPIGKERFDRAIDADLDTGAMHLLVGAYEPQSSRVYWTYKSTTGTSGLFDRIVVWDYVLERGALITGVSGEYITSLGTPGVTLEGLDSIAPGSQTVSGAADNGSGLVRLTVGSTSGWTTGDIKAVSGVTGTTEANGNWTITVIDGTNIDLQGSTFANVYVSGGTVGGSLDAMAVTLDDIPASFATRLAVVSSSHKVGFLSGAYLEATLETAEMAGGRRVCVNAVRPDTDAATVYSSLVTRNKLADLPSTSNEAAMDANGFAFHRTDARMVKYRNRIPAGTQWTFSIGVEPAVTVTTGWR